MSERGRAYRLTGENAGLSVNATAKIELGSSARKKIGAAGWAVTAACLVTLVSCSRTRRLELHDTEGRFFSASCAQGAACKIVPKGGPTSAGADGASARSSTLHASLRSNGRLIAVCGQPAGMGPLEVRDCRALVCAKNDDCPPAEGMSRGTCVNGWCIEPSHTISPDDAVFLCLAGTGLGRDSPRQLERYALAVNCGEPCRVPAVCRQP